MSEPTLNGLTPEQFIDTCEKAALRTAKEQLAATGLARPLTAVEEMCLGYGISCGGQATFDELARRGLLAEPKS